MQTIKSESRGGVGTREGIGVFETSYRYGPAGQVERHCLGIKWLGSAVCRCCIALSYQKRQARNIGYCC